MPPRIPSSRLPQPQTCQCLFRARPSPAVPADLPSSQSRQLHGSPRHAVTLQRREMFAWLNDGLGKKLRDPLPGSTNYLSAYNSRDGSLNRATRDRNTERNSPSSSMNPAQQREEDSAVKRDEQLGLTEDEKKANATDRANQRAQEAKNREGIPPERPSDLKPYPRNENFRSQAVLSEELREEIYQQVTVVGLGIDTVASSFGVDMRRVAAVVRLKTIEKQWLSDGKQLAKPYAEAVLGMLPQTPYQPNKMVPHEGINDLPVHPHTRNQIFYPTSESRQFTREDAAKVFDRNLLPADKRIPIPVLIKLEKWNLENLPREERQRRLREDDMKEREEQLAKAEKKAAWEARTQRIVPGRRWDFKFQDISAEKVNKDGRGRHAIGYRYGMPREDRKRGLVKIPTSVE